MRAARFKVLCSALEVLLEISDSLVPCFFALFAAFVANGTACLAIRCFCSCFGGLEFGQHLGDGAAGHSSTQLR